MAIEGIIQPEYIQIDEQLRLRKYDGKHDFAFEWYQDIETVKLVDGVEEPYSPGKLNGMYGYLNQHGELYFIEALEDDTLYVGEIYHFNEGSRRCFETCGFVAYEETEKGKRYRLNLRE